VQEFCNLADQISPARDYDNSDLAAADSGHNLVGSALRPGSSGAYAIDVHQCTHRSPRACHDPAKAPAAPPDKQPIAFAEGVATVRPQTAAVAIGAYRIDNPSISLSMRALVGHHHIVSAVNKPQHLPALLQRILIFLDLGGTMLLSRFRFHRGENKRTGCGTGFFLFVGACDLSHVVALHRLAGLRTIRQHVHGDNDVVTEIGLHCPEIPSSAIAT
jgi:hypothetical protein